DFGIAKRPPCPLPSGDAEAALTVPGELLGTVAYMSPEQVRAAPLDTRSDLFSFGAVLLEMLSGERPFHKDSGAETMAAILRDPPAGLHAARLASPALARIARRCLQKEPGDRHRDTAELVAELCAIRTPKQAARTGPRRHSPSTSRATRSWGGSSRSSGGRRSGRTWSKHWSIAKRRSDAGMPTAVKPGCPVEG